MWSLLLLAAALPHAASKSLETKKGCRSEDDEAAISICLRPWLDTWESLREISTPSQELLFPIFYFQRDQVLALCDVYIEKLDTCLTEALAESCSGHILVRFLNQQVGYVCGPSAVEVLSQFDCVSEAVRAKAECADLVKGVPVPGFPRPDRCRGMSRYFNCLQGSVQATCQASGLAIFQEAILNFGCDVTSSSPVDSDELISARALKAALQAPAKPRHKSLPALPVQSNPKQELKGSVIIAPVLSKAAPTTEKPSATSTAAALESGAEDMGGDKSSEKSSEDLEDSEEGSGEAAEELAVKLMPVEEDVEGSAEAPTPLSHKTPEFLASESVEISEGSEEEGLAGLAEEAAPVVRETLEFPSEAELRVREFPTTELSLSDEELKDIDSSFITDSQPKAVELEEEDFPLGFELNLKRPLEDPDPDQVDQKFLTKPKDVKILPAEEIPVEHSQPLDPSLPITPHAKSGAEEDLSEGSGEEDPKPGRILPASADVSMEVSGECSVEMEAKIVGCYAPLSEKWDDITGRAPETKKVVFPLFSYPTTDLLALCDVLQATLDDCLDDDMLSSCAKHPIMHFVDGLLGFACGRHKTDFFLTFDCIRDVEETAPECLAHIQGSPQSGLSPGQRCEGMPAYVGCMRTHLASVCTPDTMKMFLSAIQHFGCDIQGKIIQTAPGPPVEVFVKAERKLSIDAESLSEEQLKEFGSPTKDNPHRVGAPPFGVPPPPVDNSHPIISSFCTPRIRAKVRKCLRPLFVDWLGYRAANAQLGNITYPLFFYEESQLLEMCDLYASSFLDCDFPLFDVCLTDEIVRFANNHLGYICSPSKIQGFIMAFGCNKRVLQEASAECLPFIRGPSEPGNDLQRCDGMSSFYDCALHRIQESCGNAAAGQIRNAIHQFGCDVDVPNSVVQFAKIRKLA